MNELKCPFCQQELERDDILGNSQPLYYCKNRNCERTKYLSGTPKFWQELIRTRKALDVATRCINWTIDTFQKGLEHESDVVGCCELSLERIEELEQKD